MFQVQTLPYVLNDLQLSSTRLWGADSGGSAGGRRHELPGARLPAVLRALQHRGAR